ncbi:hypothetical protein GCK72_003897 [Caenorhabditis remanei]|uniref:Sushi domain-containing protein n=1 Tax=Caenorhabditis remanei TaxID=31234 RepID=A0A6A5HAQ7_CAERE|nr:hypothetical protein GCK72_003897 [Caenorhabditis remanei]KAF1763951.1 hypothetical protein GCK72_003897 [Caenorhabditis remanei]
MKSLFLLLFLPLLVHCQRELDCGFLNSTFEFKDWDNVEKSYVGGCCTFECVKILDRNDKDWRESINTRAMFVSELYRDGNCCNDTPSTVGTTETSRLTTITTTSNNTTLIPTTYHSVSQEKVLGPGGAPGGSRSNDKAGFDFETTTLSSTTPISTVLPTTTESSSTRSLLTGNLECGALTNTPCCTPVITRCLTRETNDWLSYGSIDEFGKDLKDCGCFLTTTGTTTSTETPTTPSNSSSCGWLATSFNLDAYTINGGTDFSYNGTCCSDVAVNTLKNGHELVLNTNSRYNQWDYLVNLLYCVEGACTDPPRWDNCSRSSTSSSSSTFPQTTTSSKLTTSSGRTTDSIIISTDRETSSTPSSIAASIETGKGDNNDETTTMATTSTGSTSETKITTDVESSLGTTSTKLSSEGSTGTGSTGIETTTLTATTPSSVGSTTTSEASTTVSTATSSTPTSATETTATESSVTTSEDSTTASTSTTSSTPTTSHTSFSSRSSDTTETTMTTPTASTTTVTESSTTPTSTTTESMSSASTTSGQTEQSTPTTEVTGTTTSHTTSTGLSGVSTTSGTTGTTTGTSGVSTSTSATGSTTTTGSDTTTNTNGIYSSTTPTTTPEQTTTFPWATGGTTRILPSGEIILSESLIAYENCTTVLMQLIFNPVTNTTRTESARDANGCKTSTTTLMISTTPMTTPTHSSTAKTTTYNWPTGGTTKILPSGEIILSESLIAYENCTTVLMQLIFNPSTNQTRTETTTDEYGCRTSTSTSSKFSTTPMTTTTSEPGTTASTSSKTTTYNWPTGGTTRILPSGEIILSESLIAYNNCTTVLMKLIYNPKTNKTRTETTSDAEGCKATTSSVYITTPISGGSTTPSPSDATTSFQWPTGGTTRMLPSGEIIISESLIAFKNCTTILMQLIYSPRTNTTRTETTADANGCKATSTGAVTGSPGVTSPMATPTTTETPFTFPDSKTTQILPNGEIILSESLTAYPNCTTVLKQLIFNPATNTTRTKTSSDAQGCKATTTTKPSATTPIPPTTTAKSSSTTPVAFSTASPVTTTTEKTTTPISPTTTTKSSSSGASTTAVPVTTTTPPPTTTTSPRRRTRTTTAVPVTCPFPSNLNLQYTNRPTSEEIKKNYAVGERIIHICKKYYMQELSKQPLRIYQCGEDGKWIGTLQKCVLEPGRKAEL